MTSLKIVSDRADDNSITIRAVLPPRRNGEVNFAALEAINRALYPINPDAYDPSEPPSAVLAHNDGHTADGAGVIPHGVAEAMLRDMRAIDPERDDDQGAPGEPPRCANNACSGD